MPPQDTKTALVTGASGGMGAAFAQRLADRGYDLVLVARNKERLDTLAAGITERTGRRAETLAADLTRDKDLASVEKRLRTDDAVHVLVNNAGGGLFGPIVTADPAAADELIKLNVTAFTRLATAAAAAFSARDDGVILNVSSGLAVGILPVSAVYSGTKAYVVSFSQALRQEFADTGVRVQTFMPGATRTKFWDGSGLELSALPDRAIMSLDDAVTAAFAGLDAGESVTVPSLPDSEWATLEETLRAVSPHFSGAELAARYIR
ncbi:oxidoreductase [Streptomyces camponoticapitis]|uniref:NADP-dependent 3-hydroxy acid dehydrogenase YdfG n=1 Tax=Streptomyces camponoticapitis TaxID=1616125 RepID=A0ABQ2E6T9_9ACTN|nr:SDR family NAD(P)-dependent oxidoreductase [Streptomyces camponoticapitis]GGJ92242.1 oxidoreductase [Streptomyces camponoticapitis]